MKIGLFGGTFNPPHLGHTSLAIDFYFESGIDLLIIMPSFIPPHKDCATDATFRLEMTKLAFCDLEKHGINYIVSDYEIKKGGVSYTVDTVEYLLNEYNEENLALCVGSDMFLSIESWKNPEKLLKKCSLYTKEREMGEYEKMCLFGNMLEEKYGASIHIMKNEAVEVSSTALRSSDNRTTELISPKVEDYIKKNNLYKNNIKV